MKQVLYTNRGVANKKNGLKRIITFGERFKTSDLIHTAHSVKLYDGKVFINLGSGLFVQDNNVRNIKTLEYIYKSAKTVMDSQHRLIAKRVKVMPDKVSTRYWKTLQQDPYFRASDYQLRRVRIQFKKVR
ncbi:hypothetical protein [Bombilactobacillus bombi]|uniref:hypothetical protein n=1 Tax=Bombilactobacillus bombi TaxID=1303590 RepID=UPI0035ED7245